jgi:hypothetical protein
MSDPAVDLVGIASTDPIIPHRLYGADFRMLACRVEPDPRYLGCAKVRVRVNGTSAYLCPLRVEAFLADALSSLAGLACERSS